MHPRTILTALHLRPAIDRRPPVAGRRPAIYLGVAVAGAVTVNLVVGSGPAAQAEAVRSESVSVAEQLGVEDAGGPVDVVRELEPLADLAASRSSREDAEFAAQLNQAAADQAVLDQQRAQAEAEAAARRAAEEAAAKRAAELAQLAELAAAQAKAAALAPAAKTPAAAVAGAAGSVAATTRAKISNSAGAPKPQAQAAADAVVSGSSRARGPCGSPSRFRGLPSASRLHPASSACAACR